MITEADLVRLPFPGELTEAGIVYSRRVLLGVRGPASAGLYGTVRRTVASGACHLAFRRFLGDQGIPIGVHKPAPFSDPDRYDVELGGRMCELKPYLISRAPQWQTLSAQPRLALQAAALVPLDRHVTETARARDVYVFAFVGAGVAQPTRGRRSQVVFAGQYWMHVMPPFWRGTGSPAPLGMLKFATEKAHGPVLEIGGKDASGAPLWETVDLRGGRRVEGSASLLTLNHVCATQRPAGDVRIHAPSRRLAHVIQPGDWHNVWLDGWGMVLLGWISREEFRRRAALIAPGRRVFQFDRTMTKNLAVAVSELRPITDLIRRPVA